MAEQESLATVVGENARRLRLATGATLDAVAQEARRYGLKWSTGKVGDLESGRVSPSMPTLYALMLALSSLGGEPLSMRELFAGSGPVELNDELVVPREALGLALNGQPIDPDSELLRSSEALSRWQEANAEQATMLTQAMPVIRKHRESLPDGFIDDYARALRTLGLTEERVSRQFGIAPTELLVHTMLLWGSTFSVERDRRAGVDANAQRRGQVTRELKVELQGALANGND